MVLKEKVVDKGDSKVTVGGLTLSSFQSDSSGEKTGLIRKKLPYPKAVFLILGMEFCERWCYYGMRTILILYLSEVLHFQDHIATVIYHAFAVVAYVMPLAGAIIADTFLGKFKTIFCFLSVYAVGNVILTVAATPTFNLPAITFTMIGLSLIGVGTGGIKPCVPSFGGDQFQLPEQKKELAAFFSIFYGVINAGSLISTFLSPILRKGVHCFGNSTCYPLAFAIPAVVLIASIIIFVVGKSTYVTRETHANVVIAVLRTIKHALVRRKRSPEKRHHSMDYADDKYSFREIEDIKILLRILVLYIPIPFFWALSDQQGSTWTFQAVKMNGKIGNFVILPDQLQFVTSVLVLVLIPIFSRGIYPLLGKCGILENPLQRMLCGGILAGVAFIVAGVVDVELEKTYPVVLRSGESNLNFINMANVNLTARFIKGPDGFPVAPFDIIGNNSTDFGVIPNGTYTVAFHGADINSKSNFTLRSELASTLLITPGQNTLDFTFPEDTIAFPEKQSVDALKKPSNGNPFVRIIQKGLWFNPMEAPTPELQGEVIHSNLNLSVHLAETQQNSFHRKFQYEPHVNVYSDWRSTSAKEIDVGEYNVSIDTGNTAIELPGSIQAEFGGSYILSVIADKSADGGYRYQFDTLVQPTTLHLFWLLPQCITMTIAEIMFSVSIMDFSYSEAPKSMKSVMQSAWLLTVAVGNLLVVILAALQIFAKPWQMFFLFAGLMFIDMIFFRFMANRYKPAVIDESDDDYSWEDGDAQSNSH